MNKLTVLSGLFALVSFNLVACADPEPAEERGASAITPADDDRRFINTYEPIRIADALPASAEEMRARAALDPSLTIDAISPADRSGATLAPASEDGIDRTKALTEACRVTYFCNGAGTLVLHREGTNCLLRDTILQPGWAEQYREEPVDLQKPSETWRTNARFIEVSLDDAFKTRCESNH